MNMVQGRRRLLAGVALALATACSGTSEVTPTTTSSTLPATTTTTAAVTTTTTGPVAEATLTEGVQQALATWADRAGVPGAALTLSLPDGSEVTATTGVRDLTTGESVRPDEFWRIASITKPMVSAVVLRLAEQGRIRVEAPVADYLGAGWARGYLWNGVDYGDLITVADLLAHTSGFKEYAFDPSFYLFVGDRLDVPMTPQEVVAWAVTEGAQFAPGTGYLYNTVGHVVAGLVIEAVTGRPIEVVMREELFDLADVDHLYLTPREFPPTRVPAGYVQGLLRMALNLLPALEEYRDQATVGEFYDITAVPQAVLTSAPFSGGGLEARLGDVAQVFRALFDGTVLSAESVATFTTTVLDTDYGLGISVGMVDDLVVYWHGGGVPGFRSHALYAPELDVSLVVSANLIPVDPDVGSVADEVLRLVRTSLEQ